jgi:hypothetical protein
MEGLVDAIAPRIFPAISARIYDTANSLEVSVLSPGVLLLADEAQSLTYLQKFLGIFLDHRARFTRILQLHKLALQYELTGEKVRADFFWRGVHRDLARAHRQKEFWEFLADHYNSTSPKTAISSDLLREAVVVELIVSTHAAFYRGSWASGNVVRADTHLRLMKSLLKEEGIESRTCQNLLAPLLYERMTSCSGSGDWLTAISVGKDLVDDNPDELLYRLTLARGHYLNTLRTLANATPPAEALQIVQAAAAAIEILRLKASKELCLMGWLADLYNFMAVCLLNLSKPAGALLQNAKARCYNPELESALELRDRLLAELEVFRSRIAQLQSSLWAMERPNAAGENLIQQAKLGAQAADDFERSPAAAKLLDDFAAAKVRCLWVELSDDAIPEDDGILFLLRDKLIAVLESDPSGDRFNQLWSTVVAASPPLQALDPLRVARFARNPVWADSEPSLDPPQPSVSPLIAGKAKRQRDVPFQYWVWSGENRWLKLQVVVAIMLLFGGTWFAARQHAHRATREIAYQSLNRAFNKGDYETAMRAAETFLGARISGEDLRKPEVIRLYSESLVRWFTAQDSNTGQVELEILRYRSLVDASEVETQ